MSGRMIESAVDALRTYLEANMAAKVTEINTENGDSLLVDVSEWLTGEIPIECPIVTSVIIRPAEMEVKYESAAYITVKSHLQLVVLVGDPDDTQRFRKLSRYAQALFELVHDWEATWADQYSVFWEGNWSWSSAMEEDPFLQGVLLPVQLVKQELIS